MPTTGQVLSTIDKISTPSKQTSKQIQSFGRKRCIFLTTGKLSITPDNRRVMINSGQMPVVYKPFNIRGGGIDLEPNYFKQKTLLKEDQNLSPTPSDYTWLFAKAVIERGFSSLIYLMTSLSEVLTIAKDYTSVLLESGIERQREKLLLEHNRALLEEETKSLAKIEKKKENEVKLHRLGNFLQTSWKIFNEGRVRPESPPLLVQRIEKPKVEWNFPKISFWSTPKPESRLNLNTFQYLLNFMLLLSRFKQK